MTEKLYETDSYIKEFTAKVVSCVRTESGYETELDRTAFFPMCAGQYADTGKIGDADVNDVRADGERIIHICTNEAMAGETVNCKIDWGERFRRMQNHTGEHIVSGLIYSEYGFTNVGFHLGKDIVTLDVNGKLTKDDITYIERKANNVIYENRKVTAVFPSPQELDKMEYRSKKELLGNVRIVIIDGYDKCACCAPHVSRTGEIGIIKVKSSYSYKGGTRIELLCGSDAYADYCRKTEYNSEIMHLLSSKEDETVKAVEKYVHDMSEMNLKITKLMDELALSKLKTQRRGNVIYGFTCDGCGYSQLKYCIEAMSERGDKNCILFSKTDDGYIYAVSSKEGNAKKYVDFLNGELNGRGGGKPDYAQGKASATEKQILSAFENTDFL